MAAALQVEHLTCFFIFLLTRIQIVKTAAKPTKPLTPPTICFFYLLALLPTTIRDWARKYPKPRFYSLYSLASPTSSNPGSTRSTWSESVGGGALAPATTLFVHDRRRSEARRAEGVQQLGKCPVATRTETTSFM